MRREIRAKQLRAQRRVAVRAVGKARAQGWSFDDLARRIGVTSQSVRNWVSGAHCPAERSYASVVRKLRRFL